MCKYVQICRPTYKYVQTYWDPRECHRAWFADKCYNLGFSMQGPRTVVKPQESTCDFKDFQVYTHMDTYMQILTNGH